MMKYRALLLIAVCAALLAACAAEPEDPTLVRTRDLAAERPEFWLKDFTLGNGMTSDDRVAMPEGDIGLRPRDTVYFAMYVSEEAPANASVEVIWHDPQGQAIHRETKRLQPEQEYIFFEGPDTTDWQTGRKYRIDVVANGQIANRTLFDLEQPETPIAPKLELKDPPPAVGVDDETAGTDESGESQTDTQR